MEENATTAPSPRRWPPREIVLLAGVCAAYGLLRIGALLWGIGRDGPPGSLLDWADATSQTAAAVQGAAAAAVLIWALLQRPRFAWWIGSVAVAAVVTGTAVWILRGETNGSVRVREILLAVGFAIGTAAVCGWRPAWAMRADGVLDLARLCRALRTAAVCAAAAGTASGLVVLAAQPSGAARRLAVLVLQLGLFGAFVLVLCTMMVIGEQRRVALEAARRELYQRMAQRRWPDDEDDQ